MQDTIFLYFSYKNYGTSSSELHGPLERYLNIFHWNSVTWEAKFRDLNIYLSICLLRRLYWLFEKKTK